MDEKQFYCDQWHSMNDNISFFSRDCVVAVAIGNYCVSFQDYYYIISVCFVIEI